MADSNFLNEINKRRTFAIISHPDAGKTTITEKLLLFGGAIQMAGTVKGRKASRHATSDWMAMEQQRGISVTTSVMQFAYRDCLFNLLDTPGHEDFSEDTYRTLTAVDAALMVIDAAKGVEARTIKLLEVCRLRQTPVITFINKLDREARDPIELLDEIESVLGIQCAPMTWPLGMGKAFRGIYHREGDYCSLYQTGLNAFVQEPETVTGLNSEALMARFPDEAQTLQEEMALIEGASHPFSQNAFLAGTLSPVFFGSAINNFGIRELMDAFAACAPPPQSRPTLTRAVAPTETAFSGFVFKIQANMDPAHRDRIAFLRVCSGEFKKGMKMKHLRLKREVTIHNALTFMAGDRAHAEAAWPGDIIGLHNHGTIQIGDTFTDGEELKFTGIPYFAPELFKRVRLKDPLKMKALQKGLQQLSEEGATQVFKPFLNNDLILGAVGALQFDVVAFRLQSEYKVNCLFEPVSIAAARWVACPDEKMLTRFQHKCEENLAWDGGDQLIYLAPTHANLSLTQERWPDIKFYGTREH